MSVSRFCCHFFFPWYPGTVLGAAVVAPPLLAFGFGLLPPVKLSPLLASTEIMMQSFSVRLPPSLVSFIRFFCYFLQVTDGWAAIGKKGKKGKKH